MKIFEINWSDGNKSWVSGKNVLQAIQTYCSINDFSITYFDDEDDIVELPKEEWSNYNVMDDEGKAEMNFAQWMEKNTESDIIAETE